MKSIFRLYSMINYAGIIAIILLALTFVFGIFNLDYQIHKKLAIATVSFADVHGALILYRTIKMKRAESLFK